jgi:hypothetical protein
MTGILDGLKTIAGADASKIADFAHGHFSDRMGEHGHTGRAIIETAAELCRRHPNLVGIAAGVMVERLLVAEKHHHDEHLAAEQAAAPAAALTTVADDETAEASKGKPRKPKSVKAAKGKVKGNQDHLRLHALKPGRVAMEVFGGLLLLKMAASGARIFRHKHQGEVWFAPAAKIHLWSATFCAYNTVKAFRSPHVSAWRNGAILFFGTDAIKPVLKWYRTHPAHAWENKPAAIQSAPAPAEQTPDHTFEPIVGFNLPPREFGFSTGQQTSGQA